MKYILTEIQYKLLEAIIDEVSVPMTSKIEKGGFIQIIYLVDKTEKSQTLEVTEVHGGGKFVTGTNSSGSYIVNIGGSLDPKKNTFTILKNGEYKAGSKTEGGKITGEEIIGGSKIVVKNVSQVNISDSNKNVVDKVYTSLGIKNKGENEEEEEEESQEELDRKEAEQKESDRIEKEIYDELMNDPLLMKAFYHQPKILNGLLNYGKAKGIGPAKALLSKYIGGYHADKQEVGGKRKFKKGKKVSYMVGNTSVNITDGTKTFMLPRKHIFKATYNSQGELTGSEKMEGDIYKYQIEDLKNLKGDIYKGIINVEFVAEHSGMKYLKQDITFKIIKYETN